jgi:hypothetical protein
MPERSENILKGLLWWLVVFHSVVGLLGLFAKESAVFLAEKLFNFQLELTPQMYWVLNPFAAYLFAFAGFMAIAALDPKRNTSLIYVGASLLGLRVLQRAFFLLTADDDLIASGSQVGIVITLSVTLAITVSVVLLTRKLSGVGSAD